MQTQKGMIRHQIKYSGTEAADTNSALEYKLHCDIQMTAGKQKDIARRVQNPIASQMETPIPMQMAEMVMITKIGNNQVEEETE